MSVNRKHSKTDANHATIRDELRGLGFDVDDVYFIPGLYDMLVSGQDETGRETGVRVEVKQPGKKLTDDEREYWQRQRHRNLIVAYTTEDVLRWFGRA